MKDIQTRGNCQCCGNQQAVLKTGRMSKHGYTIDHGWFNGICQGERHQPMQNDRSITDKIISDIRAEVAGLRELAKELAEGKKFPKQAGSGNFVLEKNERGHSRRVEVYVPFADAPAYRQDAEVETAIYQAESRARMGEGFSNDLEQIVNKVHGTKLIEVEKKSPTAYIQPGEKRRRHSGSCILTAKYQDGARVYYTYEGENGKIGQGWARSASWRKMELIA